MADETAQQQRKRGGPGRPFPPGVSGNPSGRPPGLRNRATMAAEALLDGQVEKLTQKAIDVALGGDIGALRICLERILPSRKDRHVYIELPAIETAEDALKASAAIVAGVADGVITPGEGSDLSNVLEKHLSAIRANSVEERLRQLELQANGTTSF